MGDIRTCSSRAVQVPLRKIFLVPEQVRREALLYYVAKCREINHIAFFQWRSIFPTKFSEPEQLEHLYRERLALLTLATKSSKDIEKKLKILTAAEQKEITNFYTKYDFPDNSN